jgi:tellurite resistance protein TerC
MTTVGAPSLWIGFIVFVLTMLAVDLGIFHRKSHVVGFREALGWSAVWVSMALGFGGLVYYWFGSERAIEFVTGYLIEWSLSVDNIFVFVLVFSALKIPLLYQHRVLFWGITTALVLRAIMIFAGTAMIARFHWIIYVFGAFLIFTGIKLFIQRNKEDDFGESGVLTFIRKFIPTTHKLEGAHFFAIEDGKRVATPLFLALVLVEITDVIFAVDSIPAIFAITTDPFIVFTSNIFAIMGLRSLFFLLAGLVEKFRYLKVGLAGVLTFVGIKMTVVDFVKIPSLLSLGVIAGILGAAVIASLLAARRDERASLAAHGVLEPGSGDSKLGSSVNDAGLGRK